jgi:hypothetical protein
MAASNGSGIETADRRQAARASDAQGETVLVVIEGCPPQTAVFLDESHLGIGIALSDQGPFKIGQRVEVVYRGMAQAGLVSSLRSYHDVMRVGLKWLDGA